MRRLEAREIRASLKGLGTRFIGELNRSSFPHPEQVRIGDDVYFGPQCRLSGEIEVGDRVMFGPGVSLFAGNHLFGRVGKPMRFLTPAPLENSRPIVIEYDAWIGANAIILGGVTVGAGAIIGAGSVVTRSAPPFWISAGNPCRPIRPIFERGDLAEHMRILGYTDEQVQSIASRYDARREDIE